MPEGQPVLNEERRCPACGGQLHPWRSVQSAEPALAPLPFTLIRCSECGTAVTVEPAPPASHDAGAYGGGAPRLHRLARPILASFDRRRLRLLRPLVRPPGRLLDAGAGRGRFVAAARRAGYEAVGLEPSNRGVWAARELDVPVIQSTIAAADLADGSLDAITLWHVLEHLDDPSESLARLAGWLRPGGALLVGVPNLGSWQARVCPARWYHLDVPRHRVHYTVPGLKALLGRHGFEPVRTRQLLLEHNPFGMWQSLMSRFTGRPSYVYNLLKRNAPARSADLLVSLAGLLLAPPAALAEMFAGLSGHGGTIAVLAKRAEYD